MLNVKFCCALDGYDLQCMLVLRSIYNDVIMNYIEDNSSNVIRVNSVSCYGNVTHDGDDWNMEDLFSLTPRETTIITQKFTDMNSTCAPELIRMLTYKNVVY